MEIAGKVVQRPMPREVWDLDRRLADMDKHGIDRQAICATVHTFFYDVEAALGACAVIQNDEIAAIARRHADRFVALATLRCRTRSVQLTSLSAPWACSACAAPKSAPTSTIPISTIPRSSRCGPRRARLKAFVLVHPHGEVFRGTVFTSYYMRNFVGLPFETTMAGAALVFGGVIERYPDIEFLPVPAAASCRTRPAAARLQGAQRAKARTVDRRRMLWPACTTIRSCMRSARSNSSSPRSGRSACSWAATIPSTWASSIA